MTNYNKKVKRENRQISWQRNWREKVGSETWVKVKTKKCIKKIDEERNRGPMLIEKVKREVERET